MDGGRRTVLESTKSTWSSLRSSGASRSRRRNELMAVKSAWSSVAPNRPAGRPMSSVNVRRVSRGNADGHVNGWRPEDTTAAAQSRHVARA